MGRNKYSKTEIDAIALLLRKKKTANRSQQKLIQILDDATIAAMKEKRARDKARDEAAREKENPTPVASDWKAAMKEWEAWEETQTKHTPHAS